MQHYRSRSLKVVRVASLSVLAAVVSMAGANRAQAQASALRGRVVIDGSSTVYPVTEAAAAAFREEFPNVNVTVGISGSGGGFKRFVRGETDISGASRPIAPGEFLEARTNKIQFIELPVALDGLSVVVSQQNDWVDKLTIEQLQAIYLEDSATRRWSDVKPEWPNELIKVYSPGTDSGTFDYFREVVVQGGRNMRPDMSTSEDDNVLVTGVAGDRFSIGYFGAAYYYENKSRLKAVPIVNPKTGQGVFPDPEQVISGAYYPLSRPLFIYVNVNSLRRPEVRRFAEFYLEHDARFATQVGYVAIPEEVGARAETFLQRRHTGSTFMAKDTEKPEEDGVVRRDGELRVVYVQENLLDTQ